MARRHNILRWRRYITTALFILLIEFLVVANLTILQMNETTLWTKSTIEKLVAGQSLAPHNDGPYDFRMFWSVGRMARAGSAAEIYQPQLLRHFEDQHQTVSDPWIYLPVTIPMAVLAGLPGFIPGFALWSISLTLLSVLVLRLARIPWPVILPTLVSPAVIWNDHLGQISFISGALFISSIANVEKRPIWAGLLMGLVAMKPQAGLLGPIIFLARRRYLAFVVAAAVVVSLILMTTLLFGMQIWVNYFHDGVATARAILVAPFPSDGEPWGTSIFWMLRSMGFGTNVSYAAQLLGAVLAAIRCWHVWRDDQAEHLPRIALTAFLALFMTPYGYTDDMCAFTISIGLLAWHHHEIRLTELLLWMWPSFCYDVSALAHIEITPVIVLIAAFRAQMMLHMPPRYESEDLAEGHGELLVSLK